MAKYKIQVTVRDLAHDQISRNRNDAVAGQAELDDGRWRYPTKQEMLKC